MTVDRTRFYIQQKAKNSENQRTSNNLFMLTMLSNLTILWIIRLLIIHFEVDFIILYYFVKLNKLFFVLVTLEMFLFNFQISHENFYNFFSDL